MKRRRTAKTAGFTLIELLVVVLIIGILAAIAVPQYFKVVERGRAGEALAYMADLNSAQSRYILRNGAYFSGAVAADSFDVALPTALRYFNIGSVTGSADAWSATLTRNASVNSYDAYSVTASFGATGLQYSCSGSNCAELLP